MSRALKLHDYQHTAIDHLNRNPRAGLFFDMGLGKTAACLKAITPDHLPVLVVSPKRPTLHVWPAEAQLWRPDLRLVVAAGDPKKRQAALGSGADIVVIGRDSLQDAVPYAGQFRTFILDELSGFKSRSSLRWKNARKIANRPNIGYVWGLTGTPSPNGLIDLWAQMYLLDGGERLEKTLTAFRGRYFYPGRQLANGVITEWLLRPEAEKRIHQKLEDICLSMDGEGRLDLPPVTYNNVTVPLEPETRRVYRAMKEEMVTVLDLVGEVHTAGNAAAVSSKLSQISAGFMYVDDAVVHGMRYNVIHREKVKAAREIVDGTGSPILMFYRFTAEKEMLTAAMPDLVHGIDESADMVDRWNRGEIPVLLANPAAVGHGLNLQYGGHTIVWVSLTWNLEEYAQANKRLDRQGQEHPVVIHHLLSPKTVDYAMLDRLKNKKSVQQALLDHLQSPL